MKKGYRLQLQAGNSMWLDMAWASGSCPVAFPSCPAHMMTTRSQHNSRFKRGCVCRSSGSVHPGVSAQSLCLCILMLKSL